MAHLNVNNLTDEQKEQLLNFFSFNLTMELRHRLMCELPMAYNAWCGREIVRVWQLSAGDVIAPVLNKCEEQKGQKPWHYQLPEGD